MFFFIFFRFCVIFKSLFVSFLKSIKTFSICLINLQQIVNLYKNKAMISAYIMVLMLVYSVPYMAFAQEDDSDRNARTPATENIPATIESSRTRLSEVERISQRINTRINNFQNRIDAIKKEMEDKCPDGPRHRGHIFNSLVRDVHCLTEDGVRDLMSESEYRDYRNRSRILTQQIEAEHVKLANLLRTTDCLQNTIESRNEEPDEHLDLVRDLKIEGLEVQADLFKLTNRTGNIDRELDSIERVYDRALLGAYLQDKIGQLLNPQVICAARRRCMTNSVQKIDPQVIQRELFPTSANPTRSDYYEKVRSSSSGAR